MKSIILTRIIESLWLDYIYVICSSCATLVLVLAHARTRLHMYVQFAPYTHFGSIVGASPVLDWYRQLGVCDAHSASLHVIVILERRSLLHLVFFMSEYLCMNSCVCICRCVLIWYVRLCEIICYRTLCIYLQNIVTYCILEILLLQ